MSDTTDQYDQLYERFGELERLFRDFQHQTQDWSDRFDRALRRLDAMLEALPEDQD